MRHLQVSIERDAHSRDPGSISCTMFRFRGCSAAPMRRQDTKDISFQVITEEGSDAHEQIPPVV